MKTEEASASVILYQYKKWLNNAIKNGFSPDLIRAQNALTMIEEEGKYPLDKEYESFH